MDKKKDVYHPGVMSLPPQRLVLGDSPAPTPEGRNKSNQQTHEISRDIKGLVMRIIAHLEQG
jgi:hypothetical protein